ncbi:hypothetical protein CMO92_03810 [Candidatus Woesearchaeota archaeon]|nr:hypothetical protein [Candidatus Woesearchaeota archaeon]|tara:strand:- start:596 stop:832 length:237 start_codon:yes stop_codon:yes gene_type:complete
MFGLYIEYKGERHKLDKGEIPGLRGWGTIRIYEDCGFEAKGLALFVTQMNLSNKGSSTYINGINLDDLVANKAEQKSK